MHGIIERIRFFSDKGKTGIDLEEASLLKDLGLEGDYHAKGGDRQISLLFAESRDKITASERQGLCFSRFKENITIRGLERVDPGVQLAVGEAVLEITGEIKTCHEECSFYEQGKSCLLAGLNLFAKVVESGIIRTGDRVEAKLAEYQ